MSIGNFGKLLALLGGYKLASSHMQEEPEHSEEDLAAMKKAEEEQRIKSSYSRSHMDRLRKLEGTTKEQEKQKLEQEMKRLQDKLNSLKNNPY